MDPDKWMDDPKNDEHVRRLIPYLGLFVLVLVGILVVQAVV